MLGNTVRDRRSERHEATRREIIDAAWDVCRAEGLAGLSLRDVGRRVGMQAPSLYSYFDSKHAIYDAMFAQGYQEFLDRRPAMPADGDVLAGLRRLMHYLVEFSTADPVRCQLMFQRTIPGFEPSAESYAISVASMTELVSWFESIGLTAPGLVDLYTALISGIVNQQLSNDPGGDRWTRLVDEAAAMFLDHARAKQKQHNTERRKHARPH
jgi:AcrR family transcriptional regulator